MNKKTSKSSFSSIIKLFFIILVSVFCVIKINSVLFAQEGCTFDADCPKNYSCVGGECVKESSKVLRQQIAPSSTQMCEDRPYNQCLQPGGCPPGMRCVQAAIISTTLPLMFGCTCVTTSETCVYVNGGCQCEFHCSLPSDSIINNPIMCASRYCGQQGFTCVLINQKCECKKVCGGIGDSSTCGPQYCPSPKECKSIATPSIGQVCGCEDP